MDKYGYLFKLVDSATRYESSYELSPEDHSIGVYDGDWEGVGISITETRYNAGSFSRLVGSERNLEDIKLTLRAPAFGTFEPKKKFRELDAWIADNQSDMYLSIEEIDKEKRAKVKLKEKQHVNIENNMLSQEYIFSLDSPFFSQVAFAERVKDPSGEVGLVFKEMSKSIIFNLQGNSVRFNNSTETFTDTSFAFTDKSIQFSKLGIPYTIELKPTSTDIRIVVNGEVIALNIPQTLVADGGNVTISTIPLQRRIVYTSLTYGTVGLTEYLLSPAQNPYKTFRPNEDNTFSVTGCTIEGIEIIQIDEGR